MWPQDENKTLARGLIGGFCNNLSGGQIGIFPKIFLFHRQIKKNLESGLVHPLGASIYSWIFCLMQ